MICVSPESTLSVVPVDISKGRLSGLNSSGIVYSAVTTCAAIIAAIIVRIIVVSFFFILFIVRV